MLTGTSGAVLTGTSGATKGFSEPKTSYSVTKLAKLYIPAPVFGRGPEEPNGVPSGLSPALLRESVMSMSDISWLL